MKQFQICNVVFTHEELKAALFNYARDNLVPIPDDAEFTIAPTQHDEFQVTMSWNSTAAPSQPDHAQKGVF